ncbi:MAG: YihY/virulence factor BrkB family protein [Alphaproteobacteria bacterium]
MDIARHNFASPQQIPLADWRAILVRVFGRMMGDNLGVLAGGVAFYGFLSVFPAIAGALMVWGRLSGAWTVSAHLDTLRGLAPGTATALLTEQMARVAAQSEKDLTLGAVVTVIFALWSASRGVTALMGAMNMAYHEKEKRGFFRLNGLAIGFTLAGIMFVSLSLAVIAAVPPILESLFLGALVQAAIHLIRWLLLVALFMLASALIYRFGPSRQKARWAWILPGASAAALVWLIASLVFSLYIANFNAYSATFGPLGAVAALLMWFWLSAYAVCMGAELNSQLELFTIQDTTTGPQRAPGERGAFVADHIEAPQTASGPTSDQPDVKIPKEAERIAARELG